MEKIIEMLFSNFFWFESNNVERIEKFSDVLNILSNNDIAQVFEVLAINNDNQDGFSSEELIGMLDASYQNARREREVVA